MRVLYVLMAVIQFSFAFHAVKTGRGAMWVTLIIVFPLVGCLAYYFVEIFPQSREHRAVRKHVRDIAKALNPDGELKRRAEDLGISDSIENRTRLADECLERGMFDDAIRLYEACLEGPYANDAGILFGCARARFYNGDMKRAGEILAKLQQAHPKYKTDDVLLLRARVYEADEDIDRALEAYEALRNRYVGFEAKYRYAALLDRVGRHQEAQGLYNFIATHARRSSLDSEQQWVKLAAKERESVAA